LYLEVTNAYWGAMFSIAFSRMTSERQKREEEIERLMRGAGRSREADADFEEKVRKAASAIIEAQTSRIRKEEETSGSEKRELLPWPKRSINTKTAGLWLVVIAAVLGLAMPTVGGALLLCGIAAIVWATVLKPSGKRPSLHTTRR